MYVSIGVIHRLIHFVGNYLSASSLKIQCKAVIELNSKALTYFRQLLVSLRPSLNNIYVAYTYDQVCPSQRLFTNQLYLVHVG